MLVERFRAFERLRGMWRSVLLGVSLVLGVVLAGVLVGGGSRPAGDQGVEGTLQAPIPLRWMKQVAKWESELRSAEHDSHYSYPTPSLQILETRIAAASRTFGFRVVALRFVRAPQGSPMLIVQAEGSPSSFAPKVGKIVGLLNPTHHGAADWNSTAYEGIFIGAQDSRGHPFLYGYNFLRARGGGQWARSPNLYAFLHGGGVGVTPMPDGIVAGRVFTTACGGPAGSPCPLRVYRGSLVFCARVHPIGQCPSARVDGTGHYRIALRPGRRALIPAPGNGNVVQVKPRWVVVVAGQTRTLNINGGNLMK